MIEFDEGIPTKCGRVTWGYNVGHIISIGQTIYRVRWLDGNETDHLRPDVNEEVQFAQAAE